MAFLESVLGELEKVANPTTFANAGGKIMQLGGRYKPNPGSWLRDSVAGRRMRHANRTAAMPAAKTPAAKPAVKPAGVPTKKPAAKFDMRQDTMRKAMAKRYEEKAPGRPWYKHPAAMIGGGALAGYATSRLMNRDE